MRNKGIRYLSSLLLIGALAAPLALQAQDRDDQQGRNDRGKNQRVYDRQHNDYHQWNANENRTYQRWYAHQNNGKPSRDYNRLNRKDQNAYWNYRHQQREQQ
jgi:hypothetical protein